jgi:hypothetical protein
MGDDKLAEVVTQDVIDTVCDDTAPEFEGLLDRIDYDGRMGEYVEEIIATLVEKFGLTQEQEDELASRLSWKLFLLPKHPSQR